MNLRLGECKQQQKVSGDVMVSVFIFIVRRKINTVHQLRLRLSTKHQ